MRYSFGHRPSKIPGEFPTKVLALDYLRGTLPNEQDFEYRSTYPQAQDADSIIFQFDGEMLAELIVAEAREAAVQDTQADPKGYPKAKKVYRLSEIRIFHSSEKSAAVGVKHNQF